MRSFTTRVLMAAIAFALINVGAVPFMSSYGIQVCPVLHNIGFWTGCQNLGLTMGISFLYAIVILWATPKLTPLRGFFGYILAVVLGCVTAAYMLNLETMMKTSRYVQVMALIAVFLGIILAYLLRWVGVSKAATYNFPTAWWRSLIAGVTPAVGVAIFNTHYIYHISEFDADDTFLTLLGITCWMVLAYMIHYRTEYRRSMIFSYGLGRLKAGDTDVRVPLFTGGIWAPLGRLLNETLTALQERGRLMRGMRRFVAKQMAEYQGRPVAQSGSAINLPVMLINIRQFKPISQSLGHEQLTQLLDLYIDEVLRTFVHHNVVMHTFDGDKILAYVEHDDKWAMEQALACCMEILKNLPRLNKTLTEQGLPALNLGIGLTQGQAFLDNLANKEHWQYALSAESVERVNGIESLTKTLNTAMVMDQAGHALLKKESQAWLVPKGEQVVSTIKVPTSYFAL